MKKSKEKVLKEKTYLFDKMMKNEASAHELVRLSYLSSLTSKEDYEDFLKIEEEYGEE